MITTGQCYQGRFYGLFKMDIIICFWGGGGVGVLGVGGGGCVEAMFWCIIMGTNTKGKPPETGK